LINSGIYHILNLPFVLQSTCQHHIFRKLFMNFSVILYSSILTSVFLWQLIHHPIVNGANCFWISFQQDRDMSDIQFQQQLRAEHDWNKQNQVSYEYEPILQVLFFQYKTELDPNLLLYIILNLLIIALLYWSSCAFSYFSNILWQFIQTFKEGIPECLLTLADEWQYLQLISLSPAWICENNEWLNWLIPFNTYLH
jgi:hypothetical protein